MFAVEFVSVRQKHGSGKCQIAGYLTQQFHPGHYSCLMRKRSGYCDSSENCSKTSSVSELQVLRTTYQQGLRVGHCRRNRSSKSSYNVADLQVHVRSWLSTNDLLVPLRRRKHR
ncbi:hypothetical protein RvY_02901 [Ramazzottius varieornatus]|uniref:Uncharacterized protein n=1 Tax=Ramazzottius varieornatus TaxID=947166 RepID=A0A1D1UQ28_RAMVA|nr:hypothetical protein RvY_02901 [Ramazzottius varieornatus]